MIDGITYVPLSDIGMEREENQDYQGHDVTPHGLLFIVADGMGGHAGGATASQMTVNHMKRALREADIRSPSDALDYSVRAANRAIFETAQRRPDLRGMGSTVVSVLMSGDVAWLAHVGDSRIYMLRDKQLMCLTKDHTMVQRMVDDGFLTEEDAENHPSSHVLSRSLGGRDLVEVEMAGAPLQMKVGDIFLLCSDGLTGLVRDGEIARTLLQYELHTAARLLVDEANSRGGYDNSTIALIRVDSLPVFTAEQYDPPPPREPVPPPPPAPSANTMQVMRVSDAAIEELVNIDSGDDGDDGDTEDPDGTLRGDEPRDDLEAVAAQAEDAAGIESNEGADDEAEAGSADALGDTDDVTAVEADSAEEAAEDESDEGVNSVTDSDDGTGDEDEDEGGHEGEPDLPVPSDMAPTEEWVAPKMAADAGLHGLEDSLAASMELAPADEPLPADLDAEPGAAIAAVLAPVDAWALPADFSSNDEDSAPRDREDAETDADSADSADNADGAADAADAADADSTDDAADADSTDDADATDSTDDADDTDITDGADDTDSTDSTDDADAAVDLRSGTSAEDPDSTADVVAKPQDSAAESTAEPPDDNPDSTVELEPAPRLNRPPANPLELAHKVVEVDDDGPRLVPHTRRIPPQVLTPIEPPPEPQAGVQHTTLLIVGVVAVTIGLLVGVFVGRAPLSNYETLIKASKLNEQNLSKQVEDLRDLKLPEMTADRDKERVRADGLQKDLELTNTALETKEGENTKLAEQLKALEAKIEALESAPDEPAAP